MMEDSRLAREMKHHATVRSLNYFGFRGYRAAISSLYARPEGASQNEVGRAAQALGRSQRTYLNMLHQAIQWGHSVVVWDDPARGGKVYKLRYSPAHSGPDAIDPPADWKVMNKPKVARGVKPEEYRPYRSRS